MGIDHSGVVGDTALQAIRQPVAGCAADAEPQIAAVAQAVAGQHQTVEQRVHMAAGLNRLHAAIQDQSAVGIATGLVGAGIAAAFIEEQILTGEDQVHAAITVGIAELHTAVGEARQGVLHPPDHCGAVHIRRDGAVDLGFRHRHHGTAAGAARGHTEAGEHEVVVAIAVEVADGGIAVAQADRGGGAVGIRPADVRGDEIGAEQGGAAQWIHCGECLTDRNQQGCRQIAIEQGSLQLQGTIGQVLAGQAGAGQQIAPCQREFQIRHGRQGWIEQQVDLHSGQGCARAFDQAQRSAQTPRGGGIGSGSSHVHRECIIDTDQPLGIPAVGAGIALVEHQIAGQRIERGVALIDDAIAVAIAPQCAALAHGQEVVGHAGVFE